MLHLEYALYLTFDFLVLGLSFHIIRKITKRSRKRGPIIPTAPTEDYVDDGFMCIMLSDGSTIPAFTSTTKQRDT